MALDNVGEAVFQIGPSSYYESQCRESNWAGAMQHHPDLARKIPGDGPTLGLSTGELVLSLPPPHQ